jgi:acetyltransferase-like isoleucine patch superfamily enzyme
MSPKLIIEDFVNIENHVQLIAHCSVVVRRNAGIGPRCVIMDASHPFFDIHDSRPIYARLSTAPSFVEIGEGALIGAGTFINPNVRIGKGSVIGANSVVRRSVPDYCVAMGNPAKIMLRYHPEEDRWLPES